jgi:hypothetical protein
MTKKLSDFKPTKRNSNRHTAPGMDSLEKSMGQVGYFEPMTAAADGEIISGDARLEVSARVFGEDDVIIVEHDGTKPIIGVRTDIPNAEDERAKQIHYAANMTAAINLDLDPQIVIEDLEAGLDLSNVGISPLDLAGLMPSPSLDPTDPANDPNKEWEGMPEFENEPKAIRTLYIHFATNEDINAFAQLIKQRITDKTKSLWYPFKKDNLHMDKDLRYE